LHEPSIPCRLPDMLLIDCKDLGSSALMPY
jgi:hypothetical protein